MKNSADQGGCYPQRPKAEVDKALRVVLTNQRWENILNE